jgi:hypothetical protein
MNTKPCIPQYLKFFLQKYFLACFVSTLNLADHVASTDLSKHLFQYGIHIRRREFNFADMSHGQKTVKKDF